jgi:hypothetical protein
MTEQELLEELKQLDTQQQRKIINIAEAIDKGAEIKV